MTEPSALNSSAPLPRTLKSGKSSSSIQQTTATLSRIATEHGLTTVLEQKGRTLMGHAVPFDPLPNVNTVLKGQNNMAASKGFESMDLDGGNFGVAEKDFIDECGDGDFARIAEMDRVETEAITGLSLSPASSPFPVTTTSANPFRTTNYAAPSRKPKKLTHHPKTTGRAIPDIKLNPGYKGASEFILYPSISYDDGEEKELNENDLIQIGSSGKELVLVAVVKRMKNLNYIVLTLPRSSLGSSPKEAKLNQCSLLTESTPLSEDEKKLVAEARETWARNKSFTKMQMKLRSQVECEEDDDCEEEDCDYMEPATLTKAPNKKNTGHKAKPKNARKNTRTTSKPKTVRKNTRAKHSNAAKKEASNQMQVEDSESASSESESISSASESSSSSSERSRDSDKRLEVVLQTVQLAANAVGTVRNYFEHEDEHQRKHKKHKKNSK